MHGTFDWSGKRHRSTERSWGAGFLALPVVLTLTLIVLALVQPVASNWISEAVQAELIGGALPDITPTQLARPAMETFAIRTN
jgi:hypothetical protein